MKKKKLNTTEVVRYPWAKWFKKSITILRRGTDYDKDSFEMAQIIRTKANQTGVEVNFKVKHGVIVMVNWDILLRT